MTICLHFYNLICFLEAEEEEEELELELVWPVHAAPPGPPSRSGRASGKVGRSPLPLQRAAVN